MVDNLKERAVNFVIGKLVHLTNRKVDVGALQRQHNAFAERVTRMQVRDLNRAWHFRVREGRLEYVQAPKEVSGGFDLTSDVIIALALGKRKWRNPAPPHDEYWGPYTPIDAVAYGEVQIWGDAASNDLLLMAKAIFKTVYPALREELRNSDESGLNGQAGGVNGG